METNSEAYTVCILGCDGFIGYHLVKRLLETEKCCITGIDKECRRINDLCSEKRFNYIKGDVHDVSLVREAVYDSDVVISLVAICNPSLYNTVPIDVIESNYILPLSIVKLCSDSGKRLIHFSTSEVYGKTVRKVCGTNYLPDEDDKDQILSEDTTQLVMGPVKAQRWSYACAKQLLERAIYAYGYEHGLEFTIIRPFNFIGPRMDFLPGIEGQGVPRVLACFVSNLLQNQSLLLVDGGLNRRCFTYIEDAVDAITAILNNRAECRGQILNVGSPDNEVTISGLADIMIDIYSRLCRGADITRCVKKNVSSREFYGDGYEDSDRRVPDISKIVRLTGWKPKTDLKTTLEATLKYYVGYYAGIEKMKGAA